MMMGFGWMGGLLVLLLWILLVVAAVWLISSLFTRHPMGGPVAGPQEQPTTARKILDERYAKGEITREQYDQMKQDIA